jgi:hypothetical protein
MALDTCRKAVDTCHEGRIDGRVVRGGSYRNNDRNVRCAIRNRNNPDNRNDNIGLRVVALSPDVVLLSLRQKCRAARGFPDEAKNDGAIRVLAALLRSPSPAGRGSG